MPSVGPQPQHIASFNQATYSCNKETAKRLCMRMKRQREAVQRNFPNSRSRVHLAKLLAITVFQVREANRYSGLRSLHVVHGDEASAFIIALFPSKALHCRENRAKTCQTLQSKSKMSVHSAMSLLTCRSMEGGR